MNPNQTISITMPSKEIRVSSRGGLGHLEYFLRLRPYENKYPSLDVVFVSIDIERAWIDEQSAEAPPIKEVGMAKLDTRELISATSKHPATKLITTTQFSTRHSSAEFKDCHDSTEFREYLFAWSRIEVGRENRKSGSQEVQITALRLCNRLGWYVVVAKI